MTLALTVALSLVLTYVVLLAALLFIGFWPKSISTHINDAMVDRVQTAAR